MSSVSGLSANLINAYQSFRSTTSLTTESMFQNLSKQLGGDGKSITKTQLDSYVKDAESGKTSVSAEKLSAVKTLQEKWDSISGGKDSITAGDMKDYSALLAKTVLGGSSSSSSASGSSSGFIDDVDQYLIDAALKSSTSEANSGVDSLLKTLLSGTTDENDDSNANLIGVLTNLIANRNSSSTVEVDA